MRNNFDPLDILDDDFDLTEYLLDLCESDDDDEDDYYDTNNSDNNEN